jgi:hypothetical protein
MHSSNSGRWLSAVAAPLAEKFGGRLTITRTGNAVCWGYGDVSAVIELAPDGALRATFIDAPCIDAVGGRPAVAAYRARSRYALSEPGATHMVADLVDFFSGVREPNFIFIDAFPR